jgi:hypothetical protein
MTAVDPAPRPPVAALERWWRDDHDDRSGAAVLLDTGFVIRGATDSYTAVTRRHLDEIMSVGVFDAFPDNPHTPEEQPTLRLAESVEDVLRTVRPAHLAPMRYDIPDTRRRGRFIEKRWVIGLSPVAADGEVLGVAVRVHDITQAPEHLVEVLAGYCEALADGDLGTAAARQRLDSLRDYLALVEEHARLATEAADMREALKSRPVIDQAKGIVMADRHCTPEEAFEVLRRLSMQSNVRVADVAAALVYQAQRG